MECGSQGRPRNHCRRPGIYICHHHLGPREIFGNPGFEVHTVFHDANGLQQGNSVRYVGVHVGKVEKVTPLRNGVDIVLRIDEGTEIPKDSRVAITTDGLLGEKIVAITPAMIKTISWPTAIP